MLKSIRLQNFFGFQDCTINLEKGANVLVGINGSGKSNFFKAIKFLNAAIGGGAVQNLLYNEWGNPDNVLFSGRRLTPPNLKLIQFTFTFDGNIINPILKTQKAKVIQYEIKLNLANPNKPVILEMISLVLGNDNVHIVFKNTAGVVVQSMDENFDSSIRETVASNVSEPAFSITNEITPLLLRLRAFIQNIRVYSLFDTSKNSNIRKPVVPLKQIRLVEDGSNLPVLLYELKENKKRVFTEINKQLEQVSDTYSGIDFSLFSQHIELKLDEKHLDKLTPALNVSDGTLKFLCLMAILYNPTRGSIVCIDEPELGLHPDMINTLNEAIEFAGKTSQVIISTHSAHLLDYFDLEQIRIFEKDENNATIVNQVTKDDFEGWYETFNPGQMWRAGDFGGNRY